MTNSISKAELIMETHREIRATKNLLYKLLTHFILKIKQ